jgi:hypothetical protein
MHRESCGGGPAGGDQLATGTGPEPRRSDNGDRPRGSLRGIPGPRRSPPPPPPSPSLPRLEAERSGAERKRTHLPAKGGACGRCIGNPAEADQPVAINWQRAPGRSHGEATTATGQGALCGEFQAPGVRRRRRRRRGSALELGRARTAGGGDFFWRLGFGFEVTASGIQEHYSGSKAEAGPAVGHGESLRQRTAARRLPPAARRPPPAARRPPPAARRPPPAARRPPPAKHSAPR